MATDERFPSFNWACRYFIDSLTGRSEHTRRNYRNDLQRLKLHLLLTRPELGRDAMGRPAPVDQEVLRRALQASGGKLLNPAGGSGALRPALARAREILDRYDLSLADITKEDIVSFFAAMEQEQGLARNSLARRLVSLRQFFTMMAREGLPLQDGIVDKLSTMGFRNQRKVPLALDEEEVRAFLRAVDNPRDRAIIYVMLFMGLRVSEVVRLNGEDIRDSEEGIIIRGKGGKQRYVPIHPQVRWAVEQYRPHRPTGIVPDRWGVPLFVSRLKRRIDPSTVRRAIKAYARKAEAIRTDKARRLSPHKFRHTFATLLLQGDVDIRYIQELLGHEHLSTTQIYTRVVRSDLHTAIARHRLSGLEPAEVEAVVEADGAATGAAKSSAKATVHGKMTGVRTGSSSRRTPVTPAPTGSAR